MSDNIPDPRERLRALMMDLSEQHWRAGWLDELEYNLWDVVLHGPKEYGYGVVSDEDREGLTKLSQESGGWFWFPDEAEEEQFIPLEEWQQHYALWEGQQKH